MELALLLGSLAPGDHIWQTLRYSNAQTAEQPDEAGTIRRTD